MEGVAEKEGGVHGDTLQKGRSADGGDESQALRAGEEVPAPREGVGSSRRLEIAETGAVEVVEVPRNGGWIAVGLFATLEAVKAGLVIRAVEGAPGGQLAVLVAGGEQIEVGKKHGLNETRGVAAHHNTQEERQLRVVLLLRLTPRPLGEPSPARSDTPPTSLRQAESRLPSGSPYVKGERTHS